MTGVSLLLTQLCKPIFWTDIFFGSVTINHGEGNAFRHLFWATVLTIEFGPTWARDFMNTHEKSTDGPCDRGADRYNKNFGIMIGTSYRSHGVTGDDWKSPSKIWEIVSNTYNAVVTIPIARSWSPANCPNG